MAKDEWHSNVVEKLRKELSERGYEPDIEKQMENMPIGYEPDIKFRKTENQMIIIEVETSRGPKVVQDIIFSSIAKAARLIIIFSDKDGRGEKRVEYTKKLFETLKKNFGNSVTSLIEPECVCVSYKINDEFDKQIKEIIDKIVYDEKF